MAGPVRTCIGCRRRDDKAALVRLVGGSGVRIDAAQREPGRGAYLHPGPTCLALAIRRRSLARALRVSGVDVDALTRSWELLPDRAASTA